jgi:glutathione synthase/RimK-type ligase-like ATP-grasp enzyme
MAKKNIGMAFSREFVGDTPLDHIGVKKPVYLRLLELCEKEEWNAYVLTRKTYKGGGIFEGSWKFNGEGFDVVKTPVKIDLVFDRSAGIKFPPVGDKNVAWVNELSFKTLARDKWIAYGVLNEYMPQTFLLENESEIREVLPKIKTDLVVFKPFNGLKGIGIFIGPKDAAANFKFGEKYKRYVAQEFVDTSAGISEIARGKHDLRIVIVNGKVVWCHVREPIGESLLANAAQGGNLTEVDYVKVPGSIKGITEKVSKLFLEKFNNPIYSLDFGIDKDGTPKIFEINDQIGFPRWNMKNRDKFLFSLIDNFKSKLSCR